MQARVGSGSFVALPGSPVQMRTEPPQRIAAQSAYSRRLRRYHDHANIPGRRAPGTLHSFQYGVPFTLALIHISEPTRRWPLAYAGCGLHRGGGGG
ncbi:hypothetical protein AB4084_36900, partial [Lysobacter sp. 2RAB21]